MIRTIFTLFMVLALSVCMAAETIVIGDSTSGGDEIIFNGLMKLALADKMDADCEIKIVQISAGDAEKKLSAGEIDAVIYDGDVEKDFEQENQYIRYRYAMAIPTLIACSENPQQNLNSEDIIGALSGKSGNWELFGDFDRAVYLSSMELNLPVTGYFFDKFLESREKSQYIYQVKRFSELIIIAQNNAGALCVGYFVGDRLPPGVKYMAVNNVIPSWKNIKDGSYPYKLYRNLVWSEKSSKKKQIEKYVKNIFSLLTTKDFPDKSWILMKDVDSSSEKVSPAPDETSKIEAEMPNDNAKVPKTEPDKKK